MEKLQAISKSGAENKYQLKKPTLVYHAQGQNGHVGFLARQSGIQKISFEKVMQMTNQLLVKKNIAKNNFQTVQNVLPKIKHHKPERKIYVQAPQSIYFQKLLAASKIFNRLPEFTNDRLQQKQHAYIATITGLKKEVKYVNVPFTSQTSVLIASRIYKSRFPDLWVQDGYAQISTYSPVQHITHAGLYNLSLQQIRKHNDSQVEFGTTDQANQGKAQNMIREQSKTSPTFIYTMFVTMLTYCSDWIIAQVWTYIHFQAILCKQERYTACQGSMECLKYVVMECSQIQQQYNENVYKNFDQYQIARRVLIFLLCAIVLRQIRNYSFGKYKVAAAAKFFLMLSVARIIWILNAFVIAQYQTGIDYQRFQEKNLTSSIQLYSTNQNSVYIVQNYTFSIPVLLAFIYLLYEISVTLFQLLRKHRHYFVIMGMAYCVMRLSNPIIYVNAIQFNDELFLQQCPLSISSIRMALDLLHVQGLKLHVFLFYALTLLQFLIITFIYLTLVFAWKEKQALTYQPFPELLDYAPKRIIKAAEERNKIQTILAIHNQNVPKTVQQVKNTRAGLMVQRRNFTKNVISKLTGYISKDFNNVLMNYGHGFTGKQMAEAPHLSGGHAHARAVVDSLQADSLQRIIGHIRKVNLQQMRAASPKLKFDIVDVGAKFSKIGALLAEATKIEFTDIYGSVKDDCPPELKARALIAIQQARVNHSQIDWRGVNAKNHLDVLITVQLAVATNINGVVVNRDVHLSNYVYMATQKQLDQLWALVNVINYYPVRPRVQKYDINYYQKELTKYQDLMISNDSFIALHMPAQERIQDWQKTYNPPARNYIFYTLFDSHYYLSGWQPRNQGRVLLVGGAFVHQLGRYILPMCQGSYVNYIAQNGQVHMKMNTSSSGTSYCHPLVEVPQVDLRIDYGWYAHIAHDCASQALNIKTVKSPKLHYAAQQKMMEYNPQALWICDQISKFDLTKYQSLNAIYQYYSKRTAGELDVSLIHQRDIQILKDFVYNTHNFEKSSVVYIREYHNSLLRIFKSQCYAWFGKIFSSLGWLKLVAWLNVSRISLHTINQIYQAKRQMKNLRLQQNEYENEQGKDFVETSRQYHGKQIDFKVRFGTTAVQKHNLARSNNDKFIDRKTLTEFCKEDMGMNERIKIKSIPMVQSDNKITRQAFFVKPTTKIEYVCDNYLSTARDDARAESMKTVDQVNDWMTRFTTQTTNAKMELNEFQTKQCTTPTGLSLINGSFQYEWSSKSVLNAIHALYKRHLVPNIKPDPFHLQAFSQMTTRYFKDSQKTLNDKIMEQNFDPILILKGKDYPDSKKIKYYSALVNQMADVNPLEGSFMTMVKSGQVYYANKDEIQANSYCGVLTGRSDRPRNIMTPSQTLCGLLTIFQSILWTGIKAADRGFCQGMTKKQLKQLIAYKKTASWKSISLDGSGFDSTQHSQIMKLVDDRFWETISPSIKHHFQKLSRQNPGLMRMSPDTLTERFLKAVKVQDNVCFTRIPQVKYRQWPEYIKQIWNRDWAAQMYRGRDMDFVQQNYIYNLIKGTTFSGHPTKTTLGNTYRSLCYAYYYCQMAGIRNPWTRDDIVQVIASGDDVVIFVKDQVTANLIKQAILRITSRNKVVQQNVRILGLGQCIQQVFSGQWWDIDFCSKWSFGSGLNFDLSRNVIKTLTTKQFYSKQNHSILKYPGLHCLAIYEGIKTEKISMLMEDILLARCSHYEIPQKQRIRAIQSGMLKKMSQIYKVPFSQQSGYTFETEINDRCSISISTLISAIQSKQLNHVNFGSTKNFNKQQHKTSQSGEAQKYIKTTKDDKVVISKKTSVSHPLPRIFRKQPTFLKCCPTQEEQYILQRQVYTSNNIVIAGLVQRSLGSFRLTLRSR